MSNVFMNGGIDGFSMQEIQQTIKDRHRHNQVLNTNSDVTFNSLKTDTIQTITLDMQNHTINNVATPTVPSDAATKEYVDNSVGADGMTLDTDQTVTGIKTFQAPPVISTITNGGTLTLPTSTDTLVGKATMDILSNKSLEYPTIIGGAYYQGTLDMVGHSIIDVLDPVTAQDAATKNYVDVFVQGLQTKQAVRVATIGSFPSFTFANNTMTGTGAIPTVDGQTMVVGDRVLVKNQSDAQYNGIYTVTALNPWSLTRAADADTDDEVVSGIYCFVTDGSTNKDQGFVLSTLNPITLNTTPLNFVKFSSQSVNVGTGLVKDGNTISVNPTLNNMTLSNVKLTGPVTLDNNFEFWDQGMFGDDGTGMFISNMNYWNGSNWVATGTAATTIKLDNSGVTAWRVNTGLTPGQLIIPNTVGYIDPTGVLNFPGANLTGNVAMNSHSITDVADPVNPQDVATKNYVDTHTGGFQAYALSAYLSTALSDITGRNMPWHVYCDTILVNTVPSSYNTTTGIWTAPYTGSYLFTCSVSFNSLTTDNQFASTTIYQSGSTSYYQIITYVPCYSLNSSLMTVQGSIILPVEAGDTISFSSYVYGVGSSQNVGINGGTAQGTYLNINKVY